MSAWRLARKDLRITLRDKVVLAVTFLLPIALATVMGTAMGAMGGGGGGGGGTPRVRVLVEDRDDSEASRALVAALEASAALRVRRVDVQALTELPADEAGEETARARVAQGDEPAGLLIPAGYAEALASGGEPGLVLYRDPAARVEQQVLAFALLPALLDGLGPSFARRSAERAFAELPLPPGTEQRARALFASTWDEFDTLFGAAGAGAEGGGGTNDGAGGLGGGLDLDPDVLLVDVLGLEVEDVVGGDDDAAAQRRAMAAQAVAGIAVMMLLFGLVGGGGTLLDEEASGTLDRLRLAPAAGRSILAGKFLFCWLLGLLQLVVLFAFARFAFDLPVFRSALPVALHSAATAAAATGFGVLFAVLCRNRKQLEGLSTLVILAMSAFGGAWWPLSMTPEWYQRAADFTLTAWAMKGYQAIFWYEQGLAGLLLPVLVLLGIAAGTGLAAALVWRRRVARA